MEDINRDWKKAEEGCPSDASKLILSGAPHDPVYNVIEKQCGRDASISDTSVDFK